MELNGRHLQRIARSKNLEGSDAFDERYDNNLGIWCVNNGLSKSVYLRVLVEASSAADDLPDLLASNLACMGVFEKVDKSINVSDFSPGLSLTRHISPNSRKLAELLVGLLEPDMVDYELRRYIRERHFR